MTEITDINGDVLVPFYVIDYKVRVGEYGDYQYETTNDEGTLFARTLPELSVMVRNFVVKVRGRWDKSQDRSFAPNYSRDYDLPALKKFKPSVPDWQDDGWKDVAAKAPRNGFEYVEFGMMRIEMRLEEGGLPEIGFSKDTSMKLVAEMERAVIDAHDRLEARLDGLKKTAEERRLAEKRAEFARLKAELGEE